MSGIRMRKAAGALLCKKISLGDDGNLVADARPCAMSRGTARRIVLDPAAPATALAAAILDMDQSEALVLGTYEGDAAEIKITKTEQADPSKGTHGRNKATIRYADGNPAPLLIDHDRKGVPEEVAARIAELGEFEGALGHVIPGLDSYARVIRASTSAGIVNTETGERFKAGAGRHVYLFARDGGDIDRFLKDVEKRAWLAGLGHIMLGATGAKLIRSIVDIAVRSPERLVFEGPPLVVPPLAQDQEARKPIAHEGSLIDTRAACPPLTADEERQYNELVAKAKGEAEPAAEAVRELAAERMAEKHGIPIESARAAIAAGNKGELWSFDEIHFDDEEIGVLSVADVLADPKRYHLETLSDPLEGPEYGKGKAQLYANGGGHVIVNSFAHGGCVYKLVHCPEYIANKVEEAAEKAPDVLAALMPFASHLNPVEQERLRDLAAKVGKVGKRAVNALLKQRVFKARAEEREARAKAAPRGGGAPRAAREKLMLVEGERLAIMNKIERVLRNPANVIGGAVLARGHAQVVLRFMAEPFKLKAGATEIDMPAGSAYLAAGRPEHLQAQCDRLFAFTRFVEGEAKPADCPCDLARYVLANADLLPVTAIHRAPVLRADGSVIETPGYDASTGIIYAPDMAFPPVPTNPTKADAEAALKRLRRPFRGFPFVTEHDRDAVVAEALTLFTRHQIPIAPAFAHDAIEAGSGKTKLFEMVATIATGATPAMLNAEVMRDETEQRKLLTTLTLAASPIAVFDNAPRGERLKSPGLSHFLTAAVYGDRLLGGNVELKAPTCTVIGVTGNAIEPAGDLTRRMIVVSLDAGCERPETRDFDFDPLDEVTRDRADLVVAALTMLRAHALAGRPGVEGRGAFGSFEQWDRLVAGAIVFAGGNDPVKLLEKTRAADPERDGLAEVLAMLEGIGAVPGDGKRAGEIVAAVRKRADASLIDAEAESWMALLQRLGKEGQPDPNRLGRFLSKNHGRVIGGARLAVSTDNHAKALSFYVNRRANNAGSAQSNGEKTAGDAGEAGDCQNPRARGDFKNGEAKLKTSDTERLETSPATPASPANGHPHPDACRFCGERISWATDGITFGDGLSAHNACYERAASKRTVF